MKLDCSKSTLRAKQDAVVPRSNLAQLDFQKNDGPIDDITTLVSNTPLV
jgi:hypothetical protein